MIFVENEIEGRYWLNNLIRFYNLRDCKYIVSFFFNNYSWNQHVTPYSHLIDAYGCMEQSRYILNLVKYEKRNSFKQVTL